MLHAGKNRHTFSTKVANAEYWALLLEVYQESETKKDLDSAKNKELTGSDYLNLWWDLLALCRHSPVKYRFAVLKCENSTFLLDLCIPPNWRPLQHLKGSLLQPVLFVPPKSIGTAVSTAPKCHCGQLCLPRTPHPWSAGATGSGSGWPRWHWEEAVVAAVPVVPGRTESTSH